MMHILNRRMLRGMLALGLAALGSVAGAADRMQMRVFAAGSLRAPLEEIISAYAAQGGPRYVARYGPSGKLREVIEQGDAPQVFASASIEHTEALYKSGKLRSNKVLTRNVLCLMAAPGVRLSAADLIDLMLDPAVKLGTSTPKADPSGDYTWELFRKIDKIRPGAYAQLDAKALKLVGAELGPATQGSPYQAAFEAKQADVFVSYCTNAVVLARQVKGLTWERFPDALNVAAVYGIGAAKSAAGDADAFVAFATGPQGEQIFARHGFK